MLVILKGRSTYREPPTEVCPVLVLALEAIKMTVQEEHKDVILFIKF